MTNNNLTDKQLADIVEVADSVLSALAGTNDEVHRDNSTKMCRLWDDLNDTYAPPEMVKAMAVELQEYRKAASEPSAWQWFYCKQWHVTNDPQRAKDVAEGGEVTVIPLYIGPHIDCVLPSELLASMEEVIRISDRDHEAWNRAKAAIESFGIPDQVAPAQPLICDVCGHDAWLEDNGWYTCDQQHSFQVRSEPVSKPYTSPKTQFKPVADLYEMQFDDGRSVAWHFDPEKAVQWLATCPGNKVIEYVKLERLQEAVTGNHPVIPAGWMLVPKEPTREMVQTVADEVHPAVFVRAVYKTMVAAAPQNVSINWSTNE